MNNEDKVAEETMNLVLKVHRYAHAHNLDITSKEDITKILTVIRPENSSEVDIDILIQGLVAFDRMTKTELAKRRQPS